MNNISIDYDVLIQEIKDQELLAILRILCPDKKDLETITKTLLVFKKYSIPLDIAMNIMMDIYKTFPKKENENEHKS